MSDAKDAKAFLGAGWPFPLKPIQGRLRLTRHEEHVEQSIQHILLTGRGERVMLPEFGAGLRRFLFEPNSPATRSAIAEAVRNALIDWEPRIDVQRVEVTADERDVSLLLIHLDYVVRGTNTFYNRVFPFYLLEGRA